MKKRRNVEKTNHIFKDLMGILTPTEITELTTSYIGQWQMILTDIAGHELLGIPLPEPELQNEKKEKGQHLELVEDGETNNIIELTEQDIKDAHQLLAELDEGQDLKCGQSCYNLFTSFWKRKYSLTSIAQNNPDYDDEAFIYQKKGASTFLLEERIRLGASQRKLKSQSVYQTYKNVASLQIHRQSKDDKKKVREKLRANQNAGHLINKKIS